MQFAELHHKLDEDADRLDRREDILTCTVFGTLIVGGRTDVLRRWLGRAVRLDGERLDLSPSGELGGYWFWPRLGGCEPDLLLLFDDLLLVIEAKYGASKGGAGDHADDGEEETEDPRDQLVREWRATAPGVDTSRLPDDLADAIAGSRRRLIYLVRRQRRAHAKKELRDSVELAGELDVERCFYLLTWQELHREMMLDQRGTLEPPPGWFGDLVRLLERRDLGTFTGIYSDLWSNWQTAWQASSVLRLRGGLDIPSTFRGLSVTLASAFASHMNQQMYGGTNNG